MGLSILPKFSKYDDYAEYVCQCDTCGDKVFFKVPLIKLKRLIGWDEDKETWQQKWNPMNQKWYLEAGRHWVETLQLKDKEPFADHQIRIYVTQKKERVAVNLVYDVSKALRTGLKRQPKSLRTKEALLKELKYLETHLP